MSSRHQSLFAWFVEATNLRTFAVVNVWFWLAQHPITVAWYLIRPHAFGGGLAILYLVQVSVAALWLSALAWWQSTRVEERQIEAEETPSPDPTKGT